MTRYASHFVYVPGRGFLKRHGVELAGGKAVRIFALEEGETAHTQWLPGVLEIEEDQRVFHCYPFDFIAMRPVSGTQRKQLR